MSDVLGFFKKEISGQNAAIKKLVPLYEDEYFFLSGDTSFDIYFKNSDRVVIVLNGFVSLPQGSDISPNSYLDYLEELYVAKPKNFHEEILGSYTICIYDKSSHELIIVKDHMGSRPIYFIDEQSFFVFSTNLNDLVCMKFVKQEVNERKLIDFLSLRVRENTSTFYRNIKRLAASEICTITDCLRTTKYQYRGGALDKGDSDSIEKFERMFHDAIKRTLQKEKNIGILLSGGLDSSAVAAGLYRNGVKCVKTFSANYSYLPKKIKSKIDESPYQEAVSETLGYKHMFVSTEKLSPFESLKLQSRYFGEPTFFPNLFIFEKLVYAAKQEMIGTLYDGQDGDTTVSHGLERIYELYKKKNFLLLIYEVVAYAFFNGVKLSSTFKFFITHIRIQLGKQVPSTVNTSMVKDSIFSKQKGLENSQLALNKHSDKLRNPVRASAQEVNYLFFKYHQIHTRSPFYDLPLTNFCCDLHSSWKLRHGRGRFILREYLRRNLSALIANRPGKANLSLGIAYNIENRDINLVKAELDSLHPVLANIVNRSKIEKYIHIMGEKDKLSDSIVSALVVFYVANRWLNANRFA